MKIRLSGIEVKIEEIFELKKNRFLYNSDTKKVRKAKYVAIFRKNDGLESALEINKHEYKLLEKLLGDENNE